MNLAVDRTTMRFWERKVELDELLVKEPPVLSLASQNLLVKRNSTTGVMEGYEEQGVKLTTSELSLRRLPNLQYSVVLPESQSGVPFLPGGMEEDLAGPPGVEPVEDEEDFMSGLRTIPPGFSTGLSLTELSGGSHWLTNCWPTEADLKAETQRRLAEPHPAKSARPGDAAEAIEEDLAEVLSHSTPSVVFDLPSLYDMKEKREWMERLDVSQPIANFAQLVPQMAHQFPFELDIFQQQAIVQMERGESIFVAAHTSAGKTVVAEYAVALSQKHHSRVIYTSPIKALSNQKFRDFRDTFGDVGLITGDIQLRSEAFCLVMTTEILRLMLYRGSEVIRDLEWVIFDEVHYINDLERGVVWEEVLILLPASVKIVLLSATVPNAAEFANWVGQIKRRKIYVISTAKRPVPLEHYLYTGYDEKTKSQLHMVVDQGGKFLSTGYAKAAEAIKLRETGGKNKSTQPQSKVATRPRVDHNFNAAKRDRDVFLTLIGFLQARDLLPVVTFIFSRRRCDEMASMMARLDLTTKEEKSRTHSFFVRCVQRLSTNDSQLPQVLFMQDLCKRGLAVHHSGILPILKEVVEMLFQQGLVKVLFATETFAMGVNMPARTVVFDCMSKHDGRQKRDLDPGEYIQMAGRAGRRGRDPVGTVILLCKAEVPEFAALHKMQCGQATKLESKFRVTYSMCLNLLLQPVFRVEDVLKRSFTECLSLQQETAKKAELIRIQEKLTQIRLEMDMVKESCASCADLLQRHFELCCQYDDCRSRAMAELFQNRSIDLRRLMLGRIVLISSGPYLNCPAVVVKIVQTASQFSLELLVAKKLAVENDTGKSAGNELELESRRIFSVAVAVQQNIQWWSDAELNSPAIETISKAAEIVGISSKVLKLTDKTIQLLYEDFKRRDQPRFRQSPPDDNTIRLVKELNDTAKSWSSSPPCLDLGVAEFACATLFRSLANLRQQLDDCDHHKCPQYSLHFRQFLDLQLLEQKVGDLEFSISDRSLLLLPEYNAKLQVLKRLGYVDENNVVTGKGKVAREIHHQELFITELMFDAHLGHLQCEEIAALLSCVTCQEKQAGRPIENQNLIKIREGIGSVVDRIFKTEMECRVHDRDLHEELNFGLLEVVYEWARGKSFAKVKELTDTQEGLIVRCIQRLDELLKDLSNAAKVVGEVALQQKMEMTSERIKKDIVFAASLYTV